MSPAAGVLPGRLRRRLTIAFILVVGVATAALALGSYLLVSRARFDESLSRAAAEVPYQLLLAEQFLPLDAERTTSLLDSFEDSGRHVLLVTDQETVPSNPAFDAAPSADALALAAAGQIAFARVTGNQLVVGGRIPGSTAQLYVIYAEDRIHQDLRQLRDALLAGWAAVLLLAAGVGSILARRTLEPVGRASAAAHAVAEGLLATRLPVKRRGRDEFGAWAESFNRMAEALEAKIAELSNAEARERRFTADVAHELRTPVTALVAAASLLREHLDALPAEAHRPAELLVADVVRLRHLVDELMEISRLDAGGEVVTPQPTDLTQLVHAIVAARGWSDSVTVIQAGATQTAATQTSVTQSGVTQAGLIQSGVTQAGVTQTGLTQTGLTQTGLTQTGLTQAGTAASTTGPERVVVQTDPRRLERVLANLIANAVEHGQRGVQVRIGRGEIRVSDRGPGIAAEHLPRLFERFYKADPSRSGPGSGLGLAIALENARLIRATIDVSSQPGQGTEFRLAMPVTQQLHRGETDVEREADGVSL